MKLVPPRFARGAAVVTGAGLLGLGLTAAPAFADGPATTVTPSTQADPAGQDIRVTGSGFDPNKNNGFGVYVAFGPKRGDDWYLNANAFQATKWVHKNASGSPSQVKMNADGTFDLTLSGIKAQYTDGDGNAVNCLTTQCYVLTFAAHGSPDRSQDTATPVTFVGGQNPGGPTDPPGGGDADQLVTANITRAGTLSLSVAGTNVTLSDAAPGGTSTGALNKATVTDARGTNAGWTLVGQMNDLTSADGATIPAANLSWRPTASAVNDGSTGTVTPGPNATGLDVARTLASSAAGSSGGVFEAGGALDLLIPAGAVPGSYTGTLTLTLS
ncbi:MAG TPA: WxL domain-containing protein [Thermomonospora sp.]|nr:WxL domain-containing protein [Thermomonospora sp.]